MPQDRNHAKPENRTGLRSAVFCLFFLLGPALSHVSASQGQLVFDTVNAESLKNNLLGDSPRRSVIVYLPPGYENSGKRYPSLYLLHGNGGRNIQWINGRFQGLKVQTALDSLIGKGVLREMILVMPDAFNRYRGSHYANSSVAGNWLDFITDDLVRHIDTAYRTLPSPSSRGLAGHSMGGRGVLNTALKRPGVFGAIYGLSSGVMAFETHDPVEPQDWHKALELKEVADDPAILRVLGLAAAFSPNPKSQPFLVDFPYTIVAGELKRVDAVWQRWLEYDPVHLVGSRGHNLKQLRGIRFDVGRSDMPIAAENRLFSAALTAQGIPHVFEEYDGDHTNRIGERILARVLPYFSEVLKR